MTWTVPSAAVTSRDDRRRAVDHGRPSTRVTVAPLPRRQLVAVLQIREREGARNGMVQDHVASETGAGRLQLALSQFRTGDLGGGEDGERPRPPRLDRSGSEACEKESTMALPSSGLTSGDCVFVMIDHRVGLFCFLASRLPGDLKNATLGHAKTAKVLDIPGVMGTSWPRGPNGPAMPEPAALFPDVEAIDRPFANFRNDEASRRAVEAAGRRKLVISGPATEVCAALPALPDGPDGYEVHVVMDASSDSCRNTCPSIAAP